ncbi:MAG TPA: TolC family protein [Phycisphaerae bacterium]|nr:TolC family protein [Phycisphaerae bacterium]
MTERTGVEQVYDPSADAEVGQAVRALLEGGLTQDEAVRVALLNNKDFQSLFAELGASRADVVQSGLLTNPSLSLLVQFPEGGGRSKLTFGFGQQLVDLWQIPVRKNIAEAQLEQAVLAIVRRAVDLAADVRVRYSRLAALLRAEAITRENLQLVERSLQLAQARYTAGESGQLDVFLVRGTLLDVQVALINLARDRRVALADLERSMGLTRSTQRVELTEELKPPPPIVFEESELVSFALHERLDAQSAAAQVRAAEAELRRQYLNIFPSVVAGAEVERTDRRSLPGRDIVADTLRTSIANGGLTAPEIQSKDQRDQERRQIIDSIIGPSLAITLPIWDQNQAQIAKADFTVRQRRKSFEDLLDQVALDVQQSSAAMRTAQELVSFYEKETLPQAQKNVDAATRSYQAGEQSVVALIEAQRSLIDQRRTFVDIVRDSAIAKAELERAVGGRLPRSATTQATPNQPASIE